jgi:hypothetical protein
MEMLIDRLSRPRGTSRTAMERIETTREAQRRSVAYASIHRARGQMARAHYHEAMAAGFACVAQMFEDDLRSDAQHEYPPNGQVTDNGSISIAR